MTACPHCAGTGLVRWDHGRYPRRCVCVGGAGAPSAEERARAACERAGWRWVEGDEAAGDEATATRGATER